MKTLKHLLLASIMMLAFFSCSKKDASKTDLLTGKWWKMTALTVNPAIIINGTSITDWYAQFPCIQDDLQRFDVNGVHTYDNGSVKCDVNEVRTITGIWSFNADQTNISVTDGSDTKSYDIIELSSSTFKGTFTVVQDWGSGNLTYTYTVTEKPQ